MIEIKKKHYKDLDGLRAFSAIGIVCMHVLANGSYQLNGFLFESLIPSFTNLVFLFMIISGFAMCCGYYDLILNNKITVGEFYGKRYAKIWPFFAFLCVLDLAFSPSGIETLYEVFANLTLCFGLLPNADITVIGVGWFLGVVFVFYMLFPFFCYLLSNKKRAWFAFLCTCIFHELCIVYFFNTDHVAEGFSGRTNFVYCAVFFLAGGLIFLYREKLEKAVEKYHLCILLLCFISAAGYYMIGDFTWIMLIMFSMFLICALRTQNRKGILQNPVVTFISNISMEIYLCHMVIYRGLEKIGFTHLFSSEALSYIVAAGGTIAGAIVFSMVVNYGMKGIRLKWLKKN